MKRDHGASAYCMKEDTRLQGPIEWGTRPLNPASKTDWKEIKALAKANKLDEIDDGIYVRYYNTLKSIAKDHMVDEKRTFEKECIWIYGEPGVGKTRSVKEHGEYYIKLTHKWWDGY